MRTGQFKLVAFLKTILGSVIIAWIAIKITFDRIFDLQASFGGQRSIFSSINWPFIFCLTPCLLLILRHFVFGHRVSYLQRIAGLFSIMSLLLLVFYQNQIVSQNFRVGQPTDGDNNLKQRS